MSNEIEPSGGFSKYFLLALSYYAGCFFLLWILAYFFHFSEVFSVHNFLNWDAAHYDHIAHVDYTGFRNTFFPLFPFFWKYTQIGPIGISLVNGLFYVISFAFLAYTLQYSFREFLLMLSFPTLIFMFLPYAESFFFLGASMVLLGFAKRKVWIICTGLIIAALARPVACLFIPIVTVSCFFDFRKETLRKLPLYLIAIIVGIAGVVIIQHHTTGDWFAFSHAEKQWWGNDPKFPRLPFTTWGGDEVARLDGTSLLIGVSASVACFVLFFRQIKGEKYEASSELIFSLLYMAAICWFVLFTRSGSLFSLNRFVFTVPFFYVCLSHLLKIKWRWKEYLFIFFAINAFWLIMGSYVHIQEVLKYLLVTLFLMSFLFISHPKRYLSLSAYMICLLGNIALQVYFYQYFLKGGWIG